VQLTKHRPTLFWELHVKRNFEHIGKDAFVLMFYCLNRWQGAIWSFQTQCGLLTGLDLLKKLKKFKKSYYTKLVPLCKGLAYSERLRVLGIPTLKYRRYRGEMIETYKILHSI